VKINDFSDFIKTYTENHMKQVAEKTNEKMSSELNKIRDKSDINEILLNYSAGMSSSIIIVMFDVLQRYHEWLATQMKNQ
jgi:hypothetical protein